MNPILLVDRISRIYRCRVSPPHGLPGNLFCGCFFFGRCQANQMCRQSKMRRRTIIAEVWEDSRRLLGSLSPLSHRVSPLKQETVAPIRYGDRSMISIREWHSTKCPQRDPAVQYHTSIPPVITPIADVAYTWRDWIIPSHRPLSLQPCCTHLSPIALHTIAAGSAPTRDE